MKKNTLIILLSSFYFLSIAQTGKIKKAEKHYTSYSYSEAIEKYEGLEEKTPEINRKLAQSYWNIHNYQKAEDYFSLVINQENVEPLDLYKYAESLKSNGKYLESEKWMEKYYTIAAHDTRAKKHVNNKGYVQKLLKDNDAYKIKNLDINSEQQDFGATFYGNDKIVFTSSREGTVPVERKWNWNGLPFLDMYVAEKAEDGSLSNYQEFHKKLNLKYHEGPASFTQDGTLVMYTRNNYEGKDADGVIKLQLYFAELQNDDWTEEKGIHFNSDHYSVGHPTLSPDGKFMFFSSDMPGGKGGTDIYKVIRTDDGDWGEPKNLGPDINTEGDEMFPFYHPEGYLIFASNGHPGIGGLDNFITQIKDDGVGKIINMGTPLNSNYDDFSVVLDEQQKNGYFASNRTGGHGADDIYSFELLKPFKFGKTIKGVAKDPLGNMLDSVLIQLRNNNNEVISEVVTDPTGSYAFEVEPDLLFYLDGTKEAFFGDQDSANTSTDDDEIIVDLELVKDPNISLYCLVSESNSEIPIDSVKITLLNNMNNESEEILTGQDGDFSRALKEKRIGDRISYNITLEKEGYLSKTVTFNRLLDSEGQYNMHEELDFKLDKIEVGSDLSKLIDINPIYFDLNKFNIREDAAIELDKIVTVMNENPTMEIELGSHTDCRGSISMNQRLSDKRAKSSAQYIKEHIDNPKRIYGKGYGENRLVNKCECEGNKKVPCTDEEHQANRRTEFRIIKL